MSTFPPSSGQPIIIIRQAVCSDAVQLASLTSQLGYPAAVKLIRARVERILDRPDTDCLLVAEGSVSELVGWIHGFVCQVLEADYRVEIGGLIVDEQWRHQGIGRQLIKAIEDWATEQGASELSVRCRQERSEAHRFYESLSFHHQKTQHVFRKRIRKV